MFEKSGFEILDRTLKNRIYAIAFALCLQRLGRLCKLSAVCNYILRLRLDRTEEFFCCELSAVYIRLVQK